jgi:hypothetical protein
MKLWEWVNASSTLIRYGPYRKDSSNLWKQWFLCSSPTIHTNITTFVQKNKQALPGKLENKENSSWTPFHPLQYLPLPPIFSLSLSLSLTFQELNARGNNRVTMFLREINIGTWLSKLWVSELRQWNMVMCHVKLRPEKDWKKLFYERRSVGQSVLVSGHHMGTGANFSFSSIEVISRYLNFLLWGVVSDERMGL